MGRLTPDDADQRFLRRLLYVALAFALAFFLYRAGDLLLLVFGAVLCAVFLSTIADWIAAHSRLPRGLGLAMAALLLFAAIGAIGWLFVGETGRQAQRLSQTLPQDWQMLQLRLGANPLGKMLLDSGRSAAGGGKVASLALGTGWGASEVLVNFIIILFGGLFFAVDPAVYRRGIVLLVPRPQRGAAERALDDSGDALRLWLLTQLFSMIAMGAMIALGLWLSGLDSWAALGVLGGLSEFIPYIGPTLAMIPAVVVALAAGGSLWGVLATYALVRIIQANIITPLISHRVVAIPPGLYIFLILAMGYAFGLFGMFFAGALAVAAFTLVRRLYLSEALGEFVPRPGQE
jgi:predicted PurR-regulated permease PerM